MEQLAASINGSLEKAIEISKKLLPIRKMLIELDRLTVEGYVTGFENHLWLVSSTDFNSDVASFEKELSSFLEIAKKRTPHVGGIRLGVIGVPTIFTDFYQFIASKGAKVVFNEVQRQFSMPFLDDDYIRHFIDYTYPYDIYHRLSDIKKEIEKRKIDGIIHYVQSFCYRELQDVVIKKSYLSQL